MKHKHLGSGIILFGIVILSFALLWLFNSFAQTASSIICRGGMPPNWIEQKVSSCSSMLSGTTLAIRCENANAYIVRTGQKDSWGYELDSCSSSIAGYVPCSYTLAGGSEKITVYRSSCPAEVAPAPSPEPAAEPEPEPSPSPSPSPAPSPAPSPSPSTTEEPALQCSADKGLCRKRKVQECLTVCPASWEFIPPAGYTGTTSRLLGEGYTTGVNAEGKYLEGESVEDVKTEPEVIVETRIETQVVKETIVIEKEITVEVTPVEVPQTVDGGSCQTFQTDTDNAIQELFTALDSFEKTGAGIANVNSDLRRGFQQNIKGASKNLRNIKKLNTGGFECNPAHLNKIADAIQELEKGTFVSSRHDLAIMKKDEKVQPRFFGIRKDIGDTENLLKGISQDKAKRIEVEIQYFEGCKNDFGEIVLGEGLILDSEIRDVSEKCSTAKKQIEALAKKKAAKPTILKKDAKKKIPLKKSLKKKSLKKKKSSKKKR